jgi:hypothetical protein
MESVLYFESGTSFTPESVLSILKFLDSQVSSFSTLESGVSPISHVSPITQVYTRRGKNLPVNTNSIQTIQNHETCASPMSLHIPHTIVESDEATEPLEPTPFDPPTLAHISPSLVSDLHLPIALRKEPRNCPSTRYPLDRFCTYANLSIDYRAFTIHL